MPENKNIKTFDIVICGAGPAGSTCALALANSGLQVAVIEQHVFPRDKTCGDLLAAYVPKVLHTINPKYKDALGNFQEKKLINTCSIFAPNNKRLDFTIREDYIVSRRIDFDNFLYELASAENNIAYFLNHQVKNITINPNNDDVNVITNDTIFKCKLVIGCDGANGVSTKILTGQKRDLQHHAAAIKAYYKNVSCTNETFELHFMKQIKGGYFWIFPLKNGWYNVGLGLESSIISKDKINLKEEFKKIITSQPDMAERFKSAEIIGNIQGYALPLGSQKVKISSNNFMLCGDAASLINPLTGEGIGQAMVSGRYAGWHAKKCFEQNNFSADFMKQYDKMVYDKLWGSLQKSHFIQKLLKNRSWLFNGIFNIAQRNTAVKNFIHKAME